MPEPALKSNFWFILGREPLLSAAELAAVFGSSTYSPVDGNPFAFPLGKGERPAPSPFQGEVGRGLPSSAARFAVLKLSLKNFNAARVIRRLGGTVKIGQELGSNLPEDAMIKAILDELKTVSGKINFGLSFYGENGDLTLIEKWGKQIKKILKNEGHSARYVFKREPTLSSVTVDKNGLTERGREFLITSATSPDPSLERRGGQPFPLSKGEHKGVAEGEVAARFSLAKTLTVQPFEEFGARDFGRPGRDDLSGLLPPKLAMMMINLSQTTPDGAILDPFCGSGTILTEALLLGYKNLIGADISNKAISDTEKNIEWIGQTMSVSYSIVIPTTKEESLAVSPIEPEIPRRPRGLTRNDRTTTNIQLFKTGIASLSSKIKVNSIDTIITEPFLGKPLRGHETESELKQQAEELKKLYLTAFGEFKKVLKKDGAVIFLVPRFRFKKGWLTIDLKSEVEKLGFKTNPLLPGHEYLTYARPNQLVGREVWRFVN